MKILVTGGAGFVGTTLIPQLLEQGHGVRVLDNLMFGGDQLLPFFSNQNFEFVKGDVRSLADIQNALIGCDAVIHLAAIVGYPACRQDPALAREVNVDGARNVLEAASPSQKILYASTGSNYGSLDEICTEESPLNPLSIYGETKAQAEAILMESDNSTAFRFATAFGLSPRLRLDLLINDFAFKAYSEGYLVVYEKDFLRTFIHVYDMGRAFLFALNNWDKTQNEIFNVGSDDLNRSKEQICQLLEKKTDLYVHYADVGEDADKRDYVVSYEKIHSIGYSTTKTIEQGVDELLRAFDAVSIRRDYSNV
ncbi:MAG: NAD(P)-dependent oxidoreductase [Chloroflexi bacterium]|nr:NAD(P)-dependent oxidoreductase [Chloroflexota bacterium]